MPTKVSRADPAGRHSADVEPTPTGTVPTPPSQPPAARPAEHPAARSPATGGPSGRRLRRPVGHRQAVRPTVRGLSGPATRRVPGRPSAGRTADDSRVVRPATRGSPDGSSGRPSGAAGPTVGRPVDDLRVVRPVTRPITGPSGQPPGGHPAVDRAVRLATRGLSGWPLVGRVADGPRIVRSAARWNVASGDPGVAQWAVWSAARVHRTDGWAVRLTTRGCLVGYRRAGWPTIPGLSGRPPDGPSRLATQGPPGWRLGRPVDDSRLSGRLSAACTAEVCGLSGGSAG
jgi:hypothetical protein